MSKTDEILELKFDIPNWILRILGYKIRSYKGYQLLKMLCEGEIKANQKVSSVSLDYKNCTLDFVIKDRAENIMDLDFELLEENKEIEEIPTKIINTSDPIEHLVEQHNKTNELVRAVNKLIRESEERKNETI